MTTTTVTSGSNNVGLPTGTINVSSTTGFAASGTITISVSGGSSGTITYTGPNTATTFVGCTGGTGTMVTGDFVVQSVDNGATILEDASTKVVPAYNTGNPSGKTGNYDVFSYSTSGGADDKGPSVFLLSNRNLPYTLSKFYKMTGYYATGATYETFVVIGAPSAATCTNPNTGHTLTNTFVDSYWLA